MSRYGLSGGMASPRTRLMQITGAFIVLACVIANGIGPFTVHAGDHGAEREDIHADAQGGVEGRGIIWGYYAVVLVLDKNVRTELRLTPEHEAEILTLAEEYAKAVSRLPAADQRPSAASQTDDKGLSRIVAIQEGLQRTYSERLLKSLSDSQQKRLSQVAFQLRSVEILYYARVADALQLTAQQRAEIARIRTFVAQEAKRLHGQSVTKARNTRLFDEQVDQLFAEAKERALKIMSEEQRRRLQSLEGPKIAFARHDLVLEFRKAARSDGPKGAPHLPATPAKKVPVR